jgi:outer membrane receptor protein involved in Fe transport
MPITFFGNYGEGFKLPSFYAVGNPLVGNPTLRTETSRGWELGLRTKSNDGKLRAQLSYFDLRLRNLITFDSNAFRIVNQSRLISRGVELEIDWQPDDCFEVRGGGTWNHTRFEKTQFDPENRPRWRGFLEMTARPIPPLELTIRAIASSSSKATSFKTRPRVDTLNGYGRLDLQATWKVNDRLDVFVEIQNVTDTTPREAVGFESPGIAPRAGITLRL